MAVIKGFKGYRYNQERVSPQNVITPPYDVIDNDYKAQLTALSPYNFVNIILNDDHIKSNELLNAMIDESIIVRDGSDSLYVYEQQYSANKKHYTRTGFVCLLQIEDFGINILPHERTFEKYVADRYDLMCKTKSDVGQIFLVYEDEKKTIDRLLEEQKSRTEDIKYVDQDENIHRMWRISVEDVIAKIISIMVPKVLLIADGHHRYKTAVQYNRENSGKTHVMTTLVNAYNEGLVILPTNRILNCTIDINTLKDYFDIEPLDSLEFEPIPRSFVVAGPSGKHRIILKDGYDNELDVVILHDLIFDKILNLTEEQLTQPNMELVKGNEMTIQKIASGKTAFFVNPPSLKQTFEIAKSNRVMPQKSTFFYPKVFSGFVFNRWE